MASKKFGQQLMVLGIPHLVKPVFVKSFDGMVHICYLIEQGKTVGNVKSFDGMVHICYLIEQGKTVGNRVVARGMAIRSYTEPKERVSARTGNAKAFGRAVKALADEACAMPIAIGRVHEYGPAPKQLPRRQQALLASVGARMGCWKAHYLPGLTAWDRALLDKKGYPIAQ